MTDRGLWAAAGNFSAPWALGRWVQGSLCPKLVEPEELLEGVFPEFVNDRVEAAAEGFRPKDFIFTTYSSTFPSLGEKP